ncbi:MAG: permease-like cell division protein FtsX [Lachnospiraceae bacterium]|nr:permease-like cell division protein FtsX [Lachnospiraceae bacterium]
MKINTLLYTIRRGFANLFHNKWYSLVSVATIAACLFLLGLFYCIVVNIQNTVLKAEEGVAVTVFFEEGTSEAEEEKIGQDIAARIEVSKVEFHSADEAWAEFGPAYFGEDYQEGFPENPLEGMENYSVYLSDVSMQDALVTWLESIPEVRKVNYSAVTATTLSSINQLIAYMSVGMIAVLLGVSVFLISNTVSVGIQMRKEEIEIMKYIGATDFMVRSPFVLECMIIGLIGAAIPLGINYLIYDYIMNNLAGSFTSVISFLKLVSIDEIFRILTPVSLGIGVGIGFLGSITTVGKHLRV